jgi:tripartite-type tricarboxylate transporter receptor subunit TctC
LKQIYESEEFQKAMTERGFGLQWRGAADFRTFVGQQDGEVLRIMTALGLAKS